METTLIILTTLSPLLVTGLIISVQSYMTCSGEAILNKINDPVILTILDRINQGVIVWYGSEIIFMNKIFS